MKTGRERGADWRALLRGGDPAADGCDPSPDETAALRERVVAVARAAGAAPRPGFAAPAWAAVVALGLAAWFGWLAWPPTGDSAPPPPRLATRGGSEHQPPARARQIQFATPGGTRVVWTLDPDFEV